MCCGHRSILSVEESLVCFSALVLTSSLAYLEILAEAKCTEVCSADFFFVCLKLIHLCRRLTCLSVYTNTCIKSYNEL